MAVVVAFAVTAGKFSVGGCSGVEQTAVFDDDLIGGVAVADPEFVGLLLIPGDARLAAVDFDAEAILVAGRDLAYGEATAGAVSEVQQDSAEVVCVDGDVLVVFGAERLAREGLHAALGLLAGLVKGGELAAHARDGEGGEVLDHVHPMGADVAHGAEFAVVLGLDAPVVVRVVEEPVLGVGTLDGEDFAEVAGGNHCADLLHSRVVAEVVVGGVSDAFGFSQGEQVFGLCAGHRERLLAKDVLAILDGDFGHWVVERVGCANVYGVDVGVLQKGFPIAG